MIRDHLKKISKQIHETFWEYWGWCFLKILSNTKMRNSMEFLFIRENLQDFLNDAGPCLSLWQRLAGRVAVLCKVWDAVDPRLGDDAKLM